MYVIFYETVVSHCFYVFYETFYNEKRIYKYPEHIRA